ncbi:amino acid-binding ACT protein [Microbacterium oleivorans]|uniref:glycine cleavage system protein R n=1 Tax=Microbacterium oleivorans TaxID=273677 RepID=UPI0010A445F0|nr:ACT domain-containing protein [Microbacterium oleivorans]THE09022.1 amino acid-binding ACT protein [Microbacterium oleivorans]
MAHLVLTVVGDDRPGLVNALAEQVSAAGGNWERSELAELAGAFAGIVLVSIDDESEADLIAALEGLDGMLRVTVHGGRVAPASDAVERALEVTVLGNDRPGIVRDVTAAIAAHALSIDTFRSRTLEAPMAGGTLFEATVAFRVPAGADAALVTAALEELAGEIQVDLSVV